MTLLIAQQDIATAAQAAAAAWPNTPFAPLKVQYENRNLVDVSLQTLPYAIVETVFMGGYQADLGPNPLTKQLGQIVLSACVKLGGGNQDAYRILDHFTPYLARKNFSLVRTQAAVAQKPLSQAGWEIYPLIVPFWYHGIAA